MSAAIDEVQIEPLIFPERRLDAHVGCVASRDGQPRKTLAYGGDSLRIRVGRSEQRVDPGQFFCTQSHDHSSTRND